MQLRSILATAALLSGGAAAGCGSATHDSNRSSPGGAGLGGPAPVALTGTFKTTVSRADITRAPRPDEMELGRWTLVIGNTGGVNNGRALAIGPGDSGRVSYRFGVSGHRLVIGCNNDQDLPSSGSETYTWSITAGMLTLKAASPQCRHGDGDHPFLLTTHSWTRVG